MSLYSIKLAIHVCNNAGCRTSLCLQRLRVHRAVVGVVHNMWFNTSKRATPSSIQNV